MSVVDSITGMKNFSIKELETLCGTKSHTIRMWELRYAIFSPQRTESNARKYALADLSKVLSITLLNRTGYKISHLARMEKEDLAEALGNLKAEWKMQVVVNELIHSMYEMDIERFETLLNNSYLSWEGEDVVHKIIYPFLERVGLLCEGNRLTEEHLVVTAIRKKLLWSIERIGDQKKNGKTALLFLSGERQLDLLLLYIYFQMEQQGWKVVNLGVDISLANIKEVLKEKSFDFLITYLPKKRRWPLAELNNYLKSDAPSTQVLVATGHESKDLHALCHIRSLHTHQLIDMINRDTTE